MAGDRMAGYCITSETEKMKKQKAVFLDRDGTIIHQVELLHKISQVKFFRDSAAAIKKLNQLGYFVCGITNQPVVARGIVTEREVEQLHEAIAKRLLKLGAKLDAVYFCPHHPKATLKKYRMRCGCRKPGTGMIRKAAREHHIDLKKSFMIGDAIIDVVTGKRAKVKTILVKTGPGHPRLDKMYDAKPDFTAKNLTEVAKIIEKHGK
jgi:D,D-heptose 1,7-bisphosphate phosphatase